MPSTREKRCTGRLVVGKRDVQISQKAVHTVIRRRPREMRGQGIADDLAAAEGIPRSRDIPGQSEGY